MTPLSTTIKLLVLFIGLKQSASLNEQPIWLYECKTDESCERSRKIYPSEAFNVTFEYPSVDLCRTMCGTYGGLWPRPLSAVLSGIPVAIRPDKIKFNITNVPKETHETIQKMLVIAVDNMMLECQGQQLEAVTTEVVVYLSVETKSTLLTWVTDEEYTLDIQTKDNKTVVVDIQANTVYGARHGLETLSQLVSSYQLVKDRTVCGFRLVSPARIKDIPVFPHRGLLLDTARHFIPIKNIMRTIDAMAAVKMNIFHWHVTDSQSFPLESKRVPHLSKFGAYSESEIYRLHEVKYLINYALIRGVRVVIEIDSPAHASNGWQWGKDYGYGDLAVCVNAENWRSFCVQPPCGQLNPVNPNMYFVLRDLYTDIAEILPKPALFHMGGDEVFINCWNSSEIITDYMKSKGLSLDTDGFFQLWGQFFTNALQIWDEELNAVDPHAGQMPIILWSSKLTQADRIQKFLSEDRFVIQVWEMKESSLLEELAKMGYKVISSPKDVWYLDRGFWGTTSYSNWRRMYGYVVPQLRNVLGGEVAMWSEYVDEQGLDTRIWPRAAAVAERLWTNPVSSSSVAAPRMERIRSRLVTRGIKADVIGPGWCQQNDKKCD